MNVGITELNTEIVLKNKGVIFSVYGNDNEYKGKLRVGKGTIEWCQRTTQIGNGKKMKWDKFISLFND